MTGTVDKAKEDVIHGREGYCLNVNFYSALNYYEKQVLFAQTSKGGDGRSQVETGEVSSKARYSAKVLWQGLRWQACLLVEQRVEGRA